MFFLKKNSTFELLFIFILAIKAYRRLFKNNNNKSTDKEKEKDYATVGVRNLIIFCLKFDIDIGYAKLCQHNWGRILALRDEHDAALAK